MAGLLPVYLATLAPGLTWANQSADGGDLITAAASLGIAHPTGYPTYLLLARLAQSLPIGALAWRTNLLSALCAALAAGVVVVVVQRAYGGQSRYGLVGGLLAGLAFGLSPLLWSQAVVTEVYTLHALFVALLLLAVPWTHTAQPPTPGRLRWAGLLFGVALGNHVTLALLLPVWLAALTWHNRRLQPTLLLNALLGLAAGLLVYLYLPLRALARPDVNWGNPVDLPGLWWVMSGQPYRDMAFGLPADFLLGRVQGWAGLLRTQFGLAGMVTAAAGLFFGRMRGRRVGAVTGWLVVVFSLFAIGYNTADSSAYLLPAFLALAVWLGLGAATLLEYIAAQKYARPAWNVLLAGLLAASVMLNAAQVRPALDASRDTSAEDFGRAALQQAPPSAIIFTHADRDTFALWYFHLALNERPDVAVVVEPLLGHAWYREHLATLYRELNVPAPTAAGGWRAALMAANTRPVCDAQLEAETALACALNP